MGQFDELVKQQRLKLKAEEWANGVKSLHVHKLKSMWYDTRPQDTDLGSVTDIEYNSGLIKRTLADGTVVHLGKQLLGSELIDQYTRYHA